MTNFNLCKVRGSGSWPTKDAKEGSTGYFAKSLTELKQRVLAGGPVSTLLATVPTFNDRRYITDTDRFAFFYPAEEPKVPSLLTEEEMVDLVGDFVYDEDTQLPSLVVDAKYFTLEDGTEELAILVGSDWMTAEDLAEGPYNLKEEGEDSLSALFEKWLVSDEEEDSPLAKGFLEALEEIMSGIEDQDKCPLFTNFKEDSSFDVHKILADWAKKASSLSEKKEKMIFEFEIGDSEDLLNFLSKTMKE